LVAEAVKGVDCGLVLIRGGIAAIDTGIIGGDGCGGFTEAVVEICGNMETLCKSPALPLGAVSLHHRA